MFDPPEAAGSPIPYMKRVRGLPGERVEVDAERRIRLNGALLGTAKRRALNGRALEAIKPVVIPQDHYYVHADHADSHDSRYEEIGLIPLERIRGRALPLPDVPWLGLKGPLANKRRCCHEAASSRSRLRGGRDRLRAHPRGKLRDGEGSRDVRGAVWPIEEPDLLAEIETRLEEMETSGELARMRREALARPGSASRRLHASPASSPRASAAPVCSILPSRLKKTSGRRTGPCSRLAERG